MKIADKFVGYVEKTNIKDPNAVVTKPSASTSKPAKKDITSQKNGKVLLSLNLG